jgi:hypothetical protein
MNQEKRSFLQQKIIPLLKTLQPDAKGIWGKMNGQQMVEHLIFITRNGNGKITMNLLTPEEHLPKYKEFLMSEKDFRENTRAPMLGEEPEPLQYESMEAAITVFEQELAEVFTQYETNPGIRFLHPVFGELDYDEQVQMLYKHFRHHLKQFGLLTT